jgi:hypothetical protein
LRATAKKAACNAVIVTASLRRRQISKQLGIFFCDAAGSDGEKLMTERAMTDPDSLL